MSGEDEWMINVDPPLLQLQLQLQLQQQQQQQQQQQPLIR